MTKHRADMRKGPIRAALILCIVLLVAQCARVLTEREVWWKAQTDGELYTRPVITDRHILIGNSYGTVSSVDVTRGSTAWTYKGEGAVATDLLVRGSRVYATFEDGSMRALRTADGTELWRFATDNRHAIVRGQTLSGRRLYIGDTDGTVYALDAGTGRALWRFAGASPERLSELPLSPDISWQPAFLLHRGILYYGTPTGYVYALSGTTGKPLWTFNAGSAITAMELVGGNLYVGTKQGAVHAVSSATGKAARTTPLDGAVACIKRNSPWGIPFLESAFVATQRSLYKLNATRQTPLWHTDLPDGAVGCPESWFATLYQTGRHTITAIHARTGPARTVATMPGYMHSPATLIPQWLYVRRDRIAVMLPMLIAGDSDGAVRAIDGNAGTPLWETHCQGQVFASPVWTGSRLFVGCTDGALYNIALRSGRFGIRTGPITTSLAMREAGNTSIAELTITHDERPYANPHADVVLEAEFSGPDGQSVTIPGFYYDRDTWKIRFNPPQKGEWRWALRFETPGGTKRQHGSFTSSTDTSRAFFRIAERNPKRITADGQTLFSGMGIGDAIRDSNNNGDPLDDWAVGESSPFIATVSGSKRFYPSDRIVDLPSYAKTYGPREGGFTVFRWSIDNASFNLWDRFTFQSAYLTKAGKDGDALVQQLMGEGYHIWLTMFGFSIPFTETQYPGEIAALKRYVRYVYARYGAYASMWEIANEAYAPDQLITMLAQEIKTLDHERRPVGTSWDHPDLSAIDVITPHRYVTEPAQQSDTWMRQEIRHYDAFNKPVLFGEMGNADMNWDADSALRMRVKSWVAFFEGAVLVFWNQSATTSYHNPTLHNANQYIGATERSHMRNLTVFTSGVPVDATPASIRFIGPGTHSYGLQSSRGLLGYFYHFAAPHENTIITVNQYVPARSTVIWYDPETGASRETVSGGGVQTLVSPAFTTDIALKITWPETP